LRVFAHPLRLRMLSLLTGAPLSAMELSRELSISHALASYHLRQLHAAGVIELAEVRPCNGGRERRFSYRPDPAQRAGPRPDQESEALLAEAVCVELRRRSGDAAPGAQRLGVDAELWVEPADWQAALDAIRAASVTLHERAKPPRSTGTVRVSVSAVLFAMADRSATPAGESRPSCACEEPPGAVCSPSATTGCSCSVIRLRWPDRRWSRSRSPSPC
jgi:DNA-binding transcriptional ArsR family regulator